MENTQNILVFATNIRTNNDKQLISQTLNQISEIINGILIRKMLIAF